LNFPVGSALRVKVLSVDVAKGRLDFTGRVSETSKDVSLEDISVGQILTGRITKITDRSVVVSLSDTVAGVIELIDLADDYSEADPVKYQKNDVIRVCVVRVDKHNKKVSLSARSSRILSSSLPVTDPEVTNIQGLKVNDIYRGFIRNVDDKGIFITLGHGITAFVRVGQLSDAYLKAWKDEFQRDQLVKGKIISVDHASGHVQMSLRGSVLEKDYHPPLRFTDLRKGDVVTGKVAKVEEFGVFIVVDNSEPKIRGLCHRSEIAEKRIEDARTLFKEGDAVKAKVLKIELDKRRINFGLKASYFKDDDDSSAEDQDKDDLMESVASDASVDEPDDEMDEIELDVGSASEDGGAELDGFVEDDSAVSAKNESQDIDSEGQAEAVPVATPSLKVGGFDWHGVSSKDNPKRTVEEVDSEEESKTDKPKKRKKKAEIQIDRTGDLDANGPQSADDFERLLLGEPDSSLLWLQYMAFYINLGDVDQARQLGERALKSIGLGQDEEKQNVWVALLNLEAEYGDDESLDNIFKRACEFNDPQEMHARLTSILIHAHKVERADEMFQTMLKKYTQDPKVWTNYATFLFDTKGDAERARELLPRALQILPKFTHLDLTSKFAQSEFKSKAGLPERGRTIFEGLVSSFPKRIDLYNILLDLEEKLGDEDQIRGLFERIFTRKLKPKQAKYFFKRWLAFEEKQGDERRIDEVKAKAATWVRSAGSKDS
jgi:rRNA biogenesis protein RRP5